MTEPWIIPKWLDRYYYVKWFFKRDSSLRGKFDPYLRSYVRSTGMHLPLEVRFKQTAHLPKPPVRQRRPPSETPLASTATPDTVDPEANDN
jgi:hypothetical protein